MGFFLPIYEGEKTIYGEPLKRAEKYNRIEIPTREGKIMACEDYPCCGHEMNDCDGTLYGSDESIKERVMARGAYADDYYETDRG